ncbi:MAG: outer rane lipoprotein chaperone LolA [Pseudomonadota bacterium]|jgi:outer membrane lipoprotein-sorting protein
MTTQICRSVSLLKIAVAAATFFVSGKLSIKPSQATASTTANSNSGKIAEELRILQSKSNLNTSFRVKFDQKVFSALRKKTTVSSGELVFSQPRKFRWEIFSPGKELYVNNGEWFWKYIENTKHALRMPANASDLEFLDVVFNLDRLPNKFNLEKISAFPADENMSNTACPKNHTCVTLEPLQKSGQKSIALAVDQSTGFVSVIRIEFRNGNRTLINFSAMKPEKIAASAFEFTPPPGTAVDKR